MVVAAHGFFSPVFLYFFDIFLLFLCERCDSCFFCGMDNINKRDSRERKKKKEIYNLYYTVLWTKYKSITLCYIYIIIFLEFSSWDGKIFFLFTSNNSHFVLSSTHDFDCLK